MVLDLGCGNGILGICCLLLGAKLVCAVDVVFSAFEIARGNATNLGFTEENIHFVNQDIREINLQTLNVPGRCCGYESKETRLESTQCLLKRLCQHCLLHAQELYTGILEE